MHFFEHLETSLDERNFFRPQVKKDTMVRNLRAIFQRTQLTAQEVRTLRASSRCWRVARTDPPR